MAERYSSEVCLTDGGIVQAEAMAATLQEIDIDCAAHTAVHSCPECPALQFARSRSLSHRDRTDREYAEENLEFRFRRSNNICRAWRVGLALQSIEPGALPSLPLSGASPARQAGYGSQSIN